jgi:uncharacterized caspase-like protein
VPPGTRRTDGLRRYYNDSWAIVVGIDQYKSPRIEPLTYAVADAHAVAEQLPRVGFPSDHIEVLHNKAATKEAIHKAIYGKLKMTDPNDRLLVFFALHGQLQQQQRGEEGFLLPYDADPENLPLTAFPMTEFARIGPRLPPKHILFVLDTCFSGYAGKRSAPSASKLDLSSLTQESVVQLLTAGTGGQQAIEERGHGIFTRHFLKGLEGHADPSGTGLTALKLANYIMERVIQDSDNKQTPRYARLDGEGEFLFLPPE